MMRYAKTIESICPDLQVTTVSPDRLGGFYTARDLRGDIEFTFQKSSDHIEEHDAILFDRAISKLPTPNELARLREIATGWNVFFSKMSGAFIIFPADPDWNESYFSPIWFRTVMLRGKKGFTDAKWKTSITINIGVGHIAAVAIMTLLSGEYDLPTIESYIGRETGKLIKGGTWTFND